MAIPSVPYLVTTRIIAAFAVVVPLYLVGLFGSYIATQLTVTIFFHQSLGTYEHYFHLFLRPDRHPLLGAQGRCLHRLHHGDPHLLRLQRGRRAGRCRPRDRPRDPRDDGADRDLDVLMTMLFWGLHGVRLGGG